MLSRVAAVRLVARDWGIRKAEELTVNAHDLSPGHRLLILGGYAATLAVIVASLLSGLFASPLVFFESVDLPASIPSFVLVVAIAAFIVGWAFLLTGASDSGRRVFLPTVVIWLFILWLMVGYINAGFGLLVLLGGLGLLFVVARTAHSIRWRRRPIAEFLSWLTLTAVLVVVSYALSASMSVFAVAMNTTHLWLAIMALPIWIWLGLDAVVGAIDLARFAGRVVRKILPERSIRIIGAVLIVGLPVVCAVGLAAFADPNQPQAVAGWLFLAALLGAPLSLLSIGLLALRRWQARVAVLLLSLELVFLVITFALASAVYSTGLEDWFGASNLIPPVVLFTLLATYDLAVLGTRYAEIDGRVIPRTGRVLMYFGALLLILGSSMALFSVSYQAPTTDAHVNYIQAFVAFGLMVGIVIIGLPYLVYTVVRRRDRLTCGEV